MGYSTGCFWLREYADPCVPTLWLLHPKPELTLPCWGSDNELDGGNKLGHGGKQCHSHDPGPSSFSSSFLIPLSLPLSLLPSFSLALLWHEWGALFVSVGGRPSHHLPSVNNYSLTTTSCDNFLPGLVCFFLQSAPLRHFYYCHTVRHSGGTS